MCNMNINNNAVIRGHLVKAVQLSHYNDAEGNKRPIGRFTLAVKSGSNRDDVQFLPITIFQGADVLAKYTQKGSQLLVSCTLRNNTYTKKVKGKEQTIYGGIELVCSGFEFLSNPRNSTVNDAIGEESEIEEKTK